MQCTVQLDTTVRHPGFSLVNEISPTFSGHPPLKKLWYLAHAPLVCKRAVGKIDCSLSLWVLNNLSNFSIAHKIQIVEIIFLVDCLAKQPLF